MWAARACVCRAFCCGFVATSLCCLTGRKTAKERERGGGREKACEWREVCPIRPYEVRDG